MSGEGSRSIGLIPPRLRGWRSSRRERILQPRHPCVNRCRPAWRASNDASAWPGSQQGRRSSWRSRPVSPRPCRGSAPHRNSAVLRLDVVTPQTGDPTSFALSPDGRQIVFVAAGEGGSKLWLRPLDQTTAQPLPSTEDATFPFWAPDSRAIGFFADAKLKRLDLPGGKAQELADAANGHGGAWSRDGVILFAANVISGLLRVPATGGTPTSVTRPAPSELSHRTPQFLPDGRRFIFWVGPSSPEVQGLYLGSLDAPETHRLVAADASGAYPRIPAISSGHAKACSLQPHSTPRAAHSLEMRSRSSQPWDRTSQNTAPRFLCPVQACWRIEPA